MTTTTSRGLALAKIVTVAAALVALTAPPAAQAQAQALTPAPTAARAPATPPAGDAAPVASPKETSRASPYGLASVIREGDVVARLTLALLLVMSLMSWYIILAKGLNNFRIARFADEATQALGTARTFKARQAALAADNPMRVVIERSIAAFRKHATISSHISLSDWLRQDIVQSVGMVQAKLQTGLSALATIGSISPFVGLFGTVWGIYNALVTIGISGQASIEKIAGPVGESLIMTALGLVVAVPAVLGYNWVVQRSRNTMESVKTFGSELHSQLLIDDELVKARSEMPLRPPIEPARSVMAKSGPLQA